MGVTGNLGIACFWLSLVFTAPSALKDIDVEIPTFVKTPPALVEFSNSSGAILSCKTVQHDSKIQWFLKDDTLVNNVKDLRQIDAEENLIFQPFSAESFRQDVHAAIYKCTATNTFGTIASHDIQVKAVVLQPYDVYVYDVYAMQGNTAVMRCHIPSFLSSYVNVTAWIRDSVVVIKSADLDQNSKYSLMPTGELYVKDVDAKDAMTSFQCQTYNRLNKETVKSSTSGKLFVTEPQGNVPPKLKMSSKRISVKLGEQAFLSCEVQANPPAEVTWEKDGSSDYIKTELSQRVIQVSGSLIIANVYQNDNGTYRCTSSNSLGQEYVNIELIVTEPIMVSMEKLITADVGKSMSFSCRLSGFPLQEVIWLKNGKTITFNKKIGLNKDNASIQIFAVSSEDKGIYQCCAKNEFETVCGSTALILGDEPPKIVEKFDSVVKNPGENVKLKCVAEGNPVPTISWFLDENLILSTDKISIKENLDKSGRVVSELIIDSIKTEGGGLYKCVAENQAGKDFHWSRINVYGPIGIRSQLSLSVVNGDTAILNCPMYGYPTTEIKWEKDGVLLPNDIRQVHSANDSLIILNVIRTRDSGIYNCFVDGTNGGMLLQGNIKLNVLVAPKLSPFSFQDELVQEGSRGRLQCVVVEGDTPIKIQWQKDGKSLPSDIGISIRDIDEFSSILIVPSITPRHNGKYTCIASNAAGTASFSTFLAVNVPPKILPFAFQDDQFFKGMRAHIVCAVSQGDVPIKFKWLKDGEEIISHQMGINIREYDEHANSLNIESVSSVHTGNYTCIASNKAASVSHTAQLLVYVPPKIVPFAFQDDHLIEGSLLRVSCVVSRGDLPLTITWLKDDKTLPETISVKKVDSYSIVLSIDPVKKENTGNYTCKAQNQAGIAIYSAELVVQVPPKWLLEPDSQTIKNGNNAYFHCKADGYPNPAITWMFAKDTKSIRHKLHANHKTEMLLNGTLILKNVSKEKEGRYICIASNGVGSSLSTTVLLSVLAPPYFDRKDQMLNAEAGKKIALFCVPNGDTPINIEWFYNNDLIKPSTTRFKIFEDNQYSNSTLIIEEVTRKDSNKFECKAENDFGTDSTSFILNVQEPPEAPVLNMNAEEFSSNCSIFLSWNKSFDGNSPITNYVVQYKRQVDSWQLTQHNVTMDGEKTMAKITNLQPATTYTIRLAAVNAIGTSKFSNEITHTTDADAPTGTVQNIDVEAIDGNTLRITWKAPRKETWNGAIRGYNIGYRVDGSNEPYKFSALEVPEDYTEDLIYQISKLRKYTMYTVVIQAYNDKGVGPLSEQTVVMTSEDVPSIPPQGLRCSALSSKSIYILWEPLSTDSLNGILRGYKVLYKPITEWYDSQVQFKNSDKERITLQNLEVNTNYSISVLAFTRVGDGVKTNPVYCKTHEDVPDRPSVIKVLPASSDSVVVAWKPPMRVNGDLIKYNVYYRPLSESEEMGNEALLKTEQSKTNNVHTYQSDSEYFEVKGLRKNQKYAFWVSATSAIGEGQHSDVIAQNVASSVVPATSASFDDIINTPWKRDITLPCRAVGVPTPQKKWSIGNSLVPIGGRRVLLSDGTLLINKVDNDDNGNYTCTIYNNHGKDEVHYSLIVQVPPSAPIMDIISKSKSSIQLQWKAGPNGGDSIKGYTLHYRKDGGDWENIELSPDKELYTLRNLACGANYQIYMEAFNKVGKGISCDTIRTSTEGSEIVIPTKEQLLHEGSTFVSVHLETWPTTSCPVQSFQVDYKMLYAEEWTTVSSSIRPTQRKLVIPGLEPATWYALRVTAHANGDAIPAEYKFSTRTVTGATIPPPEIKMEKPKGPVYIFYLDPYIFIPAVALLIVVIITCVAIYMWIKRKGGSVGTPSDYGSSFDTYRGPGKASSSYAASTLYATIPHHKNRSHELNPYASGRVGDYFLDSDAWIESRTLTRAIPHHSGIQGVRVLPTKAGEQMQHMSDRFNPCCQETAFACGSAFNNPEALQSNDGYDKPPKGM